MVIRNFRPDDIEGEIIQETHTFDSIYDELLWELSHDNPSYLDPAVAAKAIMIAVNGRFADYFYTHRSAVAEFSRDMQWLANSLLTDNHEYIEATINQRRDLLRSFQWAELPAITTGGLAIA